jgi:hypothetical protein
VRNAIAIIQISAHGKHFQGAFEFRITSVDISRNLIAFEVSLDKWSMYLFLEQDMHSTKGTAISSISYATKTFILETHLVRRSSGTSSSLPTSSPASKTSARTARRISAQRSVKRRHAILFVYIAK